jgi:CheY-like chemotaxis protein
MYQPTDILRSSDSSGSVLVVDDDPDVIEAMELALEGAGYRIVTARNGAEALRLLRNEAAPRVIVLDLMMPVMNGWQFRAEQVRDERLAAIPVIVVSGAGAAAKKIPFPGAAAFLEKPVALEDLLSHVQRYVRCNRTREGSSRG